MVLPYLVAGITALVVAVIEQYNRLGARFTLKNKAARWWGARILLEVAAVILALGVCRATGVDHSNKWWFGLAIGAAGPIALRLRILDYGRGDDSTPIGPAAIYEMARSLVERKIDERSAVQQTHWINFELLPALERHDVDPNLLGQYVIDYLGGMPMPSVQRDKEIDYIHDALDETTTPNRVKRELLARHAALELGAFGLLDKFLEAAEPPKRRRWRGRT